MKTSPLPFESWNATSGVPTPGNEKVHLNMWLFNGTAPDSDTSKTYEIVVSSFEFIPLDPAALQPALRILNLSSSLAGTKIDLELFAPAK